MFADFDQRDASEAAENHERDMEAQRGFVRATSKVGDVWFRYEDRTYASADEYGDYSSSHTEVEITRYKVVRVTPKGVQLAGSSYSARHPRLVLHESYKRFACGTQALALDSYLKRKSRQEAVYQARANKAKQCAFKARQGRVKYVNDPDRIPMDPNANYLSIMR